MAKSASIGEMRTRITVKLPTKGVDTDGFATETDADVFGGKVWCKWVYQHGSEVFENMRLGLGEVATITMRYSSLVTPRCKVWREGESAAADAWEIVSIDNVEEARRFLEIKVRRGVKA